MRFLGQTNGNILPEMLKWTEVNNDYVLILRQGKATIAEETQGKNKLYKPRIEDNAGNVLISFEPGFEDFELADTYVRVNLIELDKTGIDDGVFREKLASTLDMCVRLLDQPTRVFHGLRVENIKRWILRQPSTPVPSNIPTTDWSMYSFEWQSVDNQYYCQTSHGKATISESGTQPKSTISLGKVTRYSVQIEDTTGVLLKDYFAPSVDFAGAESRLREVLSELEEPFVDEVYLEYLTFTLQICQRLLPSGTDLINHIRLGYIESYLGEVLP